MRIALCYCYAALLHVNDERNVHWLHPNGAISEQPTKPGTYYQKENEMCPANPTPTAVREHPATPRRPSIIKLAMATAIAGALTLGSSPAPATAALTPTIWTHAASACTPDEGSTGRYDTHVADIKHKGTAVGEIVTRCNVANLPQFGSGNVNLLEVVYRDQDGVANAQHAVVQLVRANDDGTTTVISTFDSNNAPDGPTTRKARVSYNHSYDFARNAYYVEIRLSRTTPSVFPIVSLVRLNAVIS